MDPMKKTSMLPLLGSELKHHFGNSSMPALPNLCNKYLSNVLYFACLFWLRLTTRWIKCNEFLLLVKLKMPVSVSISDRDKARKGDISGAQISALD